MLQTITQFTTANGSTVSTGFTQSAATSTRSVNGIPTAKLAAGDLHQLILSASEPGGTPTYSRTVLAYYADGTVGRTFALSSILAVPTISSTVSSSALRPRLQGTISADYPTSFGSSFQQAQLGKSVTVSATRAYFATNQFDLEVPDIAGLSGFNAASWSLTPGQQATYNLTALNASTVTAPTDGTIFSIGGRSGAVTQSAIRH